MLLALMLLREFLFLSRDFRLNYLAGVWDDWDLILV